MERNREHEQVKHLLPEGADISQTATSREYNYKLSMGTGSL
jgi:hypothetical protein